MFRRDVVSLLLLPSFPLLSCFSLSTVFSSFFRLLFVISSPFSRFRD
jgi:hypothetical protein